MALEIDGETCFDPKKVANCFNKFSTTVASNLVDKLPSSFNLFHTESPTFQIFYKSKNVQDNKFMLKIVSEYDQEIPQLQTADNPVAPRGRAAQPSQNTRKTN